MLPFQAVTIPILLWFAYKQIRRWKGAPIVKVIYQLRWFLVTILSLLFVGDPGISSYVAQKMGIGRGVDVVVYFALLWLLYQNYAQSQEIEKLYEKLDKLVRRLALKEHDYQTPKIKD